MLTEFNPARIQALDLETKHEYKLLSSIPQTAQNESLQQIFNLLKSCQEFICWVIYLPESSKLSEQAQDFLETAAETLDILLISEQDSNTGLPELMASVNAYIDPLLHQEIPSFFYYAMAMNLPVFCHAELNKAGLPESGLIRLSTESPSNQIWDYFSSAHPRHALRGKLFHALNQSGQNQELLQHNLNWLGQHVHKIQLSAIVFWGRSGSVLLNSLLDSHPEVITMGAGHFASISYFIQMWNQACQRGHSSFAGLLDEFCRGWRFENMQSNTQAFALFHSSDPEYEASFKFFFHECIQAIGKGSSLSFLKEHPRKAFFLALHYAYYLSLGFDIQGRHLLIFQQHSPEDLTQAADICQDFPQMKILGMIRHPVRGYYSMLAYIRQDSVQSLSWADLAISGKYLFTWRHILMGWRLLEALIGQKIYGIALEELHESPEATMRALTQYLEINWHPSLLESTIDGNPLSIASGVHGRINAHSATFDPARVHYTTWREQISDLECFTLEGLLSDLFENYYNRQIPAFQKSLSLLLLFVPTRLECKGFQQAFKERSEDQLKRMFLNMAERWYYSLLFLCGFAFTGTPAVYRKTPRQFLGIPEEPKQK